MRTELALCPTIVAVEPTGSRVICDPPPIDTDEDWLVLSNNIKETDNFLRGRGFEYCSPIWSFEESGSNYPFGFASYRRGESNVLMTPSVNFYNRFVAATHAAKAMNLLDKHDRIRLFQVILYGNYERKTQ